MAVQVPPELQTPEVILRAMGSAMAGDTRSPARKLLDLLLGGNPAERMGGVAPMRIGVMPGREKIASDIIKRGLKEPWFHGTPRANAVLTGQGVDPKLVGGWLQIPGAPSYGPGFRMDPLGQTSGLRLGEPAGVSLTRSPEVARKFGDVLRVGVDVPPSSVGQFVDPEMQRLLKEAYQAAGRMPTSMSFAERPAVPSLPAASTFLSTPEEIAHFSSPAYKEAGWTITPGQTLENLFSKGLSPVGVPSSATRPFNQAMSDYLRNQGVEAIAYNPRRWAEYEMRVLDPKKAVPLGRVDVSTPGPAMMRRYLYGYRGPHATLPSIASSEGTGGLIERLRQQYLTSPEFPVRLRDVLGIAGAD